MTSRVNERHNITHAQIESCARSLTASHFAILKASLTCSYDKMAVELGLNLGTVKSRLNRARHALAATLAKKE